MKNLYGCTPASIYGNDAGEDEPNESPKSNRAAWVTKDACAFEVLAGRIIIRN